MLDGTDCVYWCVICGQLYSILMSWCKSLLQNSSLSGELGVRNCSKNIINSSRGWGGPNMRLTTLYRVVGSNFSVVRPTTCRVVCLENLGWWVVINASYCVKYTQHAILSMHSMLMWGPGGMPSENFEKQIIWDWMWGHFKVIVMHAILATLPIECYSYS